MAGKLYIVATPIGNLADISERAIETLKQVDLIAAEDTRHSKTLLNHNAIKTDICAYHEHNESQSAPKLIRQIIDGLDLALISDAGTPLINDPGYRLINAAYENNIQVIPVPGPSAVITALSASGLPTNKFVFEGYLPVKTEARKKYLRDCSLEQRTLVFYEAPHRILDVMKDMCDVFGVKRRVSIARELTKQFEQIVRDTLEQVVTKLETEEIKIKGEFVIVVEGIMQQQTDDTEALRIHQILAQELPPKKAAELTAKITGRKKNAVYQLAIDNEK